MHTMDGNKMEHSLLILGGTFSFLFALMHLVIIYIGAPAYQFFGAGDSMVSLAKRGSWVPAVVTLGVTAALFGFAGYAWAAADLVSGRITRSAMHVSVTPPQCNAASSRPG